MNSFVLSNAQAFAVPCRQQGRLTKKKEISHGTRAVMAISTAVMDTVRTVRLVKLPIRLGAGGADVRADRRIATSQRSQHNKKRNHHLRRFCHDFREESVLFHFSRNFFLCASPLCLFFEVLAPS